jgi:diguanylate cyclase (GGDEF)-like protein/PAS domain S-box-containing protein
LDHGRGTVDVTAAWTAAGLPSLEGTRRQNDFGAEIIAALGSGQTLAVDDVTKDPRTAPHAGAYASLDIQSFLAVPLVKAGQLIATLNVSRDAPSKWTEHDAFLLREVAERTWDAVERVRAEAALREERDRSREILENMDEGFVLLDRNFRVLQINAEGIRLERRPVSEIVGRVHWDVWPGSESSALGEAFKRAMAERISLRLENYYFYPDGRGVWLDVRAYPYGDGLALFYRDITERKQAEEELRQTAARLQFTLEAAQIGDWDLNLIDDTSYRSLRHDQCFGYTEPLADWGFGKFIQHVHPDDREWVEQQFQAALEQLKDWHFECRIIWPDGSVHWIAAHGSIYHVDTRPTRMSGIVLDITESKLAAQRVLAAAQRDALTGLPNRALAFEWAAHMLSAARRSQGQGAFLFIDLDRFKPINDLYGHLVGDRLLQEIAKRLTGCVRDEDLVGRLGGDEFIIVLQHVGDAQQAVIVAQHVLEALSRPFEIDSLELAISASIGISHFPEHGTDVDALVHAADLAMYHAKYEGRGNYTTFMPELYDRADASSAIEARLKRALQREGLLLHYQPVVDMKTGQVLGVEALLRLTDDGEMIGPDRFVPIAESAGLIGQLGEWVVAEACRQHEAWCAQGLPPISIAINVSPLQFKQRRFAQRLQGIVQSAHVDPSCIQIEVTESTVMGSVDEAIQTLACIRSAGIRIALDDFGTGYSSLSHLSNLPLDKLKVDQSFVRRLDHDKPSRAIIEAIIALGRTLSLKVVGEGIESEDALAYLQEHGCDQAQGYLISRPLPAGDLAEWYRQRHR